MRVLLADFKLFVFLLLFSVFIVLFDSLGVLQMPKSLFQYVSAPIQYGLYQSGAAVGKQLEFIVLIRRASQENKALRLQLGDLLTENSQLRKQLEESTILNDQQDKLNPQTFDLLPAHVISSNRYLEIDKGTNDGVTEGQAVVFKDSYIGLVKEAGSKISQVLLSTDPDSKIAVFSQNNDGRAKGMLEGQFGAELLMDKILHEENIEVGNLVYSEGTEGKLPRGLVMGKVSQVLERQNEVFKQAKVEPVYNVSDLDMVFVIRNP
ncbi:MAG: rod shape-determining protein MreC [Patescibacteria group bacterium]|nr:rod shape-determining protein MreC [Patescibacteria group bacterium]